MEHVPDSSFSRGFELAQVPANSPSFFTRSLMDIPAKPKPIKPIASKTTFHSMGVNLALDLSICG